jgi:hypothetical protein
LADVEFFVPVLRLNLDETTEAQLSAIFCQCSLKCEKKYGEKFSEEALCKLEQCIHNARKQVKAAFDRRVEVLNYIRLKPIKKTDKGPPPRDTSRSAQASMQGTPGSAQTLIQGAPILQASLHGGPAGFVEELSHGDPKGEGKAKGKSKVAWQYIHYNLLTAGLEVPNARPPRSRSPPRAAGHDQWSHWHSRSSS